MQKKTSTRLIVLLVVLALAIAPMALIAGCQPEASATTTPTKTPVSTPTADNTVEYGPYKDVLIVAEYVTGLQLQANAYTTTLKSDGTFEGVRINGDMTNLWGAMKFGDDPLVTDEKYNRVRYFTTNLKGTDIIDAKKVQALLDNGDLPYIANDINPSRFGFPLSTKKIIIVTPWDSANWDILGKEGVSANWVDWYFGGELRNMVGFYKYRMPEAEIFVTSTMPWNANIGLFGEEWPLSREQEGGIKQTTDPKGENYMGDFWAAMRTKSNFAAANEKIKAIADDLKISYIDLYDTKLGLVGSDGTLKNENTHVNGRGYQLSQKGLTLLGDALMEAAGLPKPDSVNPSWYEGKEIR